MVMQIIWGQKEGISNNFDLNFSLLIFHFRNLSKLIFLKISGVNSFSNAYKLISTHRKYESMKWLWEFVNENAAVMDATPSNHDLQLFSTLSGSSVNFLSRFVNLYEPLTCFWRFNVEI